MLKGLSTVVATEVAVEVEAMILEKQQLRLLCAAAAGKRNNSAGLERPEDGARQRRWWGRLRRDKEIKYRSEQTRIHTPNRGLISLVGKTMNIIANRIATTDAINSLDATGSED